MMQTFLPYVNIRSSLEYLDYRRLGKQRVEAMQIIRVLERGEGPWFNHPAARMWKDNVAMLKLYHDLAIIVWIERGFRNTMKPYYSLNLRDLSSVMDYPVAPLWFGDEKFHASHRSNLLRKDPVWYGQFGWKEDSGMEYVWPV